MTLLAAARSVAPALLLAAIVASAPAARAADAPAAVPAKPDLARGEAIAGQVCVACHSFDGSRGAPANPIIAGQHPEYLAKQLADFKSGARPNPIMKGFATALNEADMRNVAAFYASKHARPGTAKSKELAELGERIWRGGIADRRIAACAGCHSPNGAGMPVQYPRLAGQHGDYTEAQMRAFRGGGRSNLQMNGIAAHLSDKEIKAVSDYIAGLR